MSPILGVLLIVTAALVSPLSAQQTCTSDAECPNDLCCLLGPSRFSIPTCTSYQQEGEQCRVNAELITTNLSYPDNSRLEIKNVSYILCPCAKALSCNPKTGICIRN